MLWGTWGGAQKALDSVSVRARGSRDISTQMSFTNDAYVALVRVACTVGNAMVQGLQWDRQGQLSRVREAVEKLDALSAIRENGELLVAIAGMRRVADAVRHRWS